MQYIQRFLICNCTKQHFVVDISGSPKYDGGGSQDGSLEPSHQVVQVGEDWVSGSQGYLKVVGLPNE